MKLASLSLAIALAASAGLAAADDGQRLVRNVSSSPGLEENPEPEGEHAFIKLMNFHVPAQSADGTLLINTAEGGIQYIDIDGLLRKTETKAKPLVNVYVYGPVIGFEEPEASGFAGHGRRDAFGAVSLDDGETWKTTNLSNSAAESSFEVSTPLQDPGCADDPDAEPPVVCEDITDYPGDVPNVFHAVAGNRVMVAWHSKYCTGGSPVFGDTFPADDVAGYLGIDNTVDLYLTDMFGVAGSQSSVDYTEQDRAVVGEVPYSCLWSARGVLRENPETTGTTELVWFQAERLTSGARDVNRVETACVAGAGCAVTWQEDPEGVRPGEGEGPGTGWSGATTASKTDIWYSFVEWEDFDIIDNGTDVAADPVPLGDLVLDTGRPQPYVPMMSAVRLTNNDRCKVPVADSGDYCENDVAAPYGIIDQCVGTVEVPLGNQSNLSEICVVDSNGDDTMNAGDMPNLANTAASRPRLNMQPRDSDGDDVVDDAWVIIVSEEDKGLGRYGFINTEEWTLGDLEDTATKTCLDPPNNPDEETGCQKADVGKDVFWASFNLGTPATSEGIDVDYSLVSNVLVQGGQLNQPEVNWRTGVYYPPMSTAQMWDFGELNYLIFNTEIARRTSLMTQSTEKAGKGKGLVAMPLWKQGIVNQGGPADISARRFVYCPIPFEDEDGPVITVDESKWVVQYLGDGSNIKIKGTVTELDEHQNTGYFIRDASNTDYVFVEENTEPDDWANFVAENLDYPPCYIQASDEDPNAAGESVGNWGEAFDLTEYWEAIGVECECTGPSTTQSQNLSAPDAAESFSWLALKEGISDAVASMKLSASAAAESFSWLALLGISDAAAASENPYDFSNMECAWYDGEGGVFEGIMYFDPDDPENTGGSNPYYPDGLCMAAPINLSARTPYECEASGESDGVCPGAADMTCVDDAAFGQLCSSETNPEDNKTYDKLVTWYECPGWNGTNVSGDAVMQAGACGSEPDSALIGANLDDASWYNPLEVSKAHRGFLDGNHAFMIYAWSPNFKLNAVGSDRYELYTRRTFDGGITWTTTPASFTASDGLAYSGSGTTTCETMRDGASVDATHVCTEYAAGVPEQSRNVSQHKSMKITTLDPRYTPTVAEMATEGDLAWGIFEPVDPTDIRDPSRNFVVFETGDNTTVAEGEAEPLNLDYGRAELFGDHFTVWSEVDLGNSDPTTDCYPSNAHDTTDVDWAVGTGFCNEFDTLEGFPLALSEEASITSSAYGDFLYAVWGQFNVEEVEDPDTGETHLEFVDGDSMFRRVWYLDDYISTDNAYTLPGTN